MWSIGQPQSKKSSARNADTREAQINFRSVPEHKQKRESVTGHERNEKQMELIGRHIQFLMDADRCTCRALLQATSKK